MNKNLLFSLLSFCSINIYANFNFYKDLSLKPLDMDKFGTELTKELFSHEGWPSEIELDRKHLAVEYTLNEKLSDYIKQELKRYRSDYASVVVIDNETGNILSAVDYTRETQNFGKNLTFSSTNPAASIFKVVTAADLIENFEIDTESLFSYAGKSTTLYKYQLKSHKNKWTRSIPLKKAFALSNNVVFGKAAINNTSYSSLANMATKFRFNQENLQVVDLGNSIIGHKGGDYELAELASGFNKETMMSPVHGAIIASIIANGGLFRKPTLVKSIENIKQERIVWTPPFSLERTLSEETASAMQELMETTVRKGTARSAFSRPKSRVLADLKIGGKTGTITGGLPYGRRDWFVSYAMPQDEKNKGISVCVMIVNVKKWYIKSTMFARKVIEHYYKNIATEI